MRKYIILGLVLMLGSIDISEAISARTPGPSKFIAIEKEVSDIAKKIEFVVPSSRIPTLMKPTESTGFLENYSASSFLISYRGRLFLQTAGHVWTNDEYKDMFQAIYYKENWLTLSPRNKRSIMTLLDLAALEVTELNPQIGGVLKPDVGDLVYGKSVLFVICNPIRFKSYFVGFYGGLEVRKEADVEKTYLIINFPGDGVKQGCSGSPVIDLDGFVRGVTLQGDNNVSGFQGRRGYAAPALWVAEFLDASYFQFK